MNSSDKASLELARKLRESADGSSEGFLRSALSRSYYSLYHMARAADRKVNHGNIIDRVSLLHPECRNVLRTSLRLRQLADYDPKLVDREASGDLNVFRSIVVRPHLDDANDLFRILELHVVEIENAQ